MFYKGYFADANLNLRGHSSGHSSFEQYIHPHDYDAFWLKFGHKPTTLGRRSPRGV